MAAQYLQQRLMYISVSVEMGSSKSGSPARSSLADELRQIGKLEALEADRNGRLLLDDP